MARHIHLRTELSIDELERRYRAAKEPHERSWWQILWLLSRGQLAKEIAESTGYSRYWIGQIAKRYNVEGADGMRNRQYTHSHRAALLLSPEQMAELAQAVRGPAPDGRRRRSSHRAARARCGSDTPVPGGNPGSPRTPARGHARD